MSTPKQGCTPWRCLDLDETPEEVSIGESKLMAIHAINVGTTPRYLKFYDALFADVVVGTTQPVWTCCVPSTGDITGGGFTLSIPLGLYFSTGIVVAATTGINDSDTGAPGSNEVNVNLAIY